MIVDVKLGLKYCVPSAVFAVFDGHAGAGCAVTASNDLWAAVQSRLESVATQLVGEEGEDVEFQEFLTNFSEEGAGGDNKQ